MGLDTELNVSVETTDPGDPLAAAIRSLRRGLIAEHLGDAKFDETSGIVAALDDRARRREGRLRLHPSPTEQELTALAVIDPQALPFDPAAPESHDRDRSLFVGGLGALWTLLTTRDGAQLQAPVSTGGVDVS
jgi:hypothetical protein